MRVGVYEVHGNGGATRTCPAMARGAEACGETVVYRTDKQYNGPDCDVAVFWGFVQTCQDIMKGYRNAGKPVVYLDSGYFNRNTHFKVSVNGRHPTSYFQKVKHDSTRRVLYPRIQPWHLRGKYVLVAGMSAKAAWAEKCEPAESWERAAIVQLQKYTDRQIMYRPKPSWSGATRIKGAIFSGPSRSLEVELADAWAVVTHHSNVASDGLVAGVPAFVWHGVAAPLGLHDLAKIEWPYYPEEREQWLNDLSYCQWSTDEMRSGQCWRHLKSEGLLECVVPQ